MTSTRHRPRVCVWELTLACNCRCSHCGSSAGTARAEELTTDEAKQLIVDLRALGCETVTFSGGEPLLRGDWPELARAVRQAGMAAELMTNGLALAEQADPVANAGFRGVSISIDGPAELHDNLRNRPGALSESLMGAAALAQRGVRIGAVTQINRRNAGSLEELQNLIVEHGFSGWLVQLTLPHGRAATCSADEELCLGPADLPELEQTLLRLAERGGNTLLFQAADTIGYMSRHEPRLRTAGDGGPRKIWSGCQAGMQALGITSDGTVRGCLSQPPAFDEGNIRTRSLAEIWNAPQGFAYNRAFDPDSLEEACADCAFGAICRAGCTGLAWVATGRTTTNPYCLRALSHKQP